MATSASIKLNESLNRLFDGIYTARGGFSNEYFFYNSSSSKMLVCKKGTNIEIPICCFSESILYLTRLGNNIEVSIPLRHNISEGRRTYKTAHMLFYNLITNPSTDSILRRVIAPHNEVYYGSNGLLLDADKNPLLLTAVKVEGNSSNFMNLTEVILYVSPKVFNGTGILHKYIRDKVIPHLTSLGVYVYLGYNLPRSVTNNIGGDSSKVKPKIIISDSIDNFFTSPFEVKDCEEASDIMLNNFEDFFKFLKDV